MTSSVLSCLLLGLALPASRPIPTGETLAVLVFRGGPSTQRFTAGRAADLLVAAQVLEPVLSLDDGSSLARITESSPMHLVLEPLPGGFVGDRALGPSELAGHLYSLARPDSPAAHVVVAIEGARERIAGDPGQNLGIEVLDTRLQIRLAEPYPQAALLLATLASAAPERLDTTEASIGLGAFRIDGVAAARLLAEPRHRQGRPFADELDIVRIQTPFGLRTELRRRRGVATFGVPGQTGPDAARTRRLDPRGFPATELTFLSAGRRSDLPIDLLHSIGAALPRERLAEREWAGEVLPAPSVRAGADGVLVAERRLSAPRSATLSYLEDEGPGRRLIERLQLDLLRLGVSARLEPLDLGTFEARRKSRSFDLLVEPVTLEGSEAEPAVHEFHRLLALAAHFGVLTRALAPGDLSRFALADVVARAAQLARLEGEVLRAARTIPLVRRDLETRVAPELEGVRMRSFGLPELGNAHLMPSEQGP